MILSPQFLKRIFLPTHQRMAVDGCAIMVTNAKVSGCAEINVPVNASAYGSGWVCNLGFKRQGQKCVEMSKKEKQDQIKQIQIYQASQRSKILNYDGEEFTLRDVERKM